MDLLAALGLTGLVFVARYVWGPTAGGELRRAVERRWSSALDRYRAEVERRA